MKGKMNIEFSENYDQEDDVYYVTFKSGEPSYVQEIDDVLLLELGMFTHMPTGFRILNYTKHQIKSVQIMVKKVKKTIEDIRKASKSDFNTRESQIERKLEEVLA